MLYAIVLTSNSNNKGKLMKKYIINRLVVIIFTFMTNVVLAHPGRTAADGCHKNSSTGFRHCHNSTPAPVEQPPVEQPPVEPPVEQPPVEQPPVEQPPVEQPPVEQPPVEQPPVEQPPVEQPPVEQPPVEQPPVEQPPVEQPPVEQLVEQEIIERTKQQCQNDPSSCGIVIENQQCHASYSPDGILLIPFIDVVDFGSITTYQAEMSLIPSNEGLMFFVTNVEQINNP